MKILERSLQSLRPTLFFGAGFVWTQHFPLLLSNGAHTGLQLKQWHHPSEEFPSSDFGFYTCRKKKKKKKHSQRMRSVLEMILFCCCYLMELNSLKALSLLISVTCNLFAALLQWEIPFPWVTNPPWIGAAGSGSFPGSLDSWQGIIGHDWMQLLQLLERLKNSSERLSKMVLINSELESFYLLSIKQP